MEAPSKSDASSKSSSKRKTGVRGRNKLSDTDYIESCKARLEAIQQKLDKFENLGPRKPAEWWRLRKQ